MGTLSADLAPLLPVDQEELRQELRDRTRLLCESLAKVDDAGLSPAQVLPELITIFRETTGWSVPRLPFGLFGS